MRWGAALALAAFWTTFGYELARAGAESLFLARHGSGALPGVWLLVGAAMAGAVTLHRRALTRYALGRVYSATAAITALSFALVLGAVEAEVPGARYALYVLKDLYVVLLIEDFWSLASLTHGLRSAERSYGLYLVAGSLGGALGGWVVGAWAARWGTTTTLGVLVPLHLALAAYVELVLRPRANSAAPARAPGGSWRDGLTLLRTSPYLGLVLALVALVQVASTGIDFAYSRALEAAYPAVDARTEAAGQVYAAIELGSAILQLAAGPILRAAGVPSTLVALPLLLALPLGWMALTPGFSPAALAKVSGKVIDYSLFRAAKELVYLPLDAREKLHGKALVDMLGYRVAKAVGSLLLLGLGAAGLVASVGWGVLALMLAWVALAARIGAAYRARTSPTPTAPEIRAEPRDR